MECSYFRIVELCAILGVLVFTPAYALAEANGRYTTENADTPLTDFMTTSAVRNIEAVESECFAREKVYQLDCLRQGLELVWRRLPYHGDYGPMRESIQRACAGIASAVGANADRAATRLDSGLNANARFPARRHYTPVRQDRLATTKASALQALSGLQASLERSARKSDLWARHYGRITVLIRQIAVHLP